MAKSSEIDFFQDHCILIQYWILSRPFGIYTVKLASEIDSFQDHCVYKQNWLISRPLQDYSSYFVKLTSFKTIQKRKITIVQLQNSKSDIWTHFRTIHEEMKNTGHRGQGQFISHCHLHHSGNTLFCIDILVTLILISRPSKMAFIV